MYAIILQQNLNFGLGFFFFFCSLTCSVGISQIILTRENWSLKVSTIFNIKVFFHGGEKKAKPFVIKKQHVLKISMHKCTPTNASDKMNSQTILCGFPRSATKTLRYNLAHVPVRKLNRFRAKPINSTLYCCNADLQRQRNKELDFPEMLSNTV